MSGSKSPEEVQFQPKSPWQQGDCIGNREGHVSNAYGRSTPSTIEAVYGSARVRCCQDEICKRLAAELALNLGKRM